MTDDMPTTRDLAARIVELLKENEKLRAGWLDQAARCSTEIVRLETEVERLRLLTSEVSRDVKW